MRINPRQLEKMARQMGIQSVPIDAKEVVIITKENKIVISNPDVAKVKMMGQETFQVSGGEVSEEPIRHFTEDDIKMIMTQTGAHEDEAVAALEETDDIAEAIVKLKKKNN
jgi:alpha-NAC-related protein